MCQLHGQSTEQIAPERMSVFQAVKALCNTGLHSLEFKSDAITEDGLLHVARYLMYDSEHDFPYGSNSSIKAEYRIWGTSDLARVLLDNIGPEDVRIASKGQGKYRGKFVKRVSQFVKDAYGIKLSDKDLNHIGQLAAQNREKAGIVYFDIVDDFDWRDGQFGKSDSCWWGSYGASRDILAHVGGLAIRFYSTEGDYTDTSYSRRGCGRTWLGPITLESDGKTEEEALLLFNAYGPYTLRQVANIIKQTTNLDCGLIRLKDLQHSSDMYINDDNGYALCQQFEGTLYGQQFTYGLYSSDVDAIYDSERYTCYNCGDRLDEDDVYMDDDGDAFCYDCYYERYCHCDSCDSETQRDDAYTVSNQDSLCSRCYNRRLDTGEIAECDHCGEAHYTSDMQELIDGDYLCSYCARHHADECAECSNWDYDSNLTNGLCSECVERHEAEDAEEEQENEEDNEQPDNAERQPTSEQQYGQIITEFVTEWQRQNGRAVSAAV